MATFAKLREIVEEPLAASAIDDASSLFDRFDDAWEGLKWLLARKADSLGEASRGGNANLRLYVQAGDAIADAPEIWLLFEIENNQIVVHSIKFLKAANEQDEDPA
ncbi:MAG: hypothetical protein EAY70_12305 [Sphingomonadales bacterium]|nr:MAG: hypothetical protein EAY70_12305 [Sphingomonadales bacterium]